MKFAHSFWSKPLYNCKFDKFEESLKNILSNYTLSLLLLHTHHESVTLYTDKKGAELLSFLPYDNVVIIDGLDNESIHFAAQIKFEALKRMDLGDVLIDGDLFLRSQEVINIIKDSKEDVICSFFEPYQFTLENPINRRKCVALSKLLTNIVDFDVPSNFKDFEWMNTSLMKFNNKQLLDEYIRRYEYNKQQCSNIDFKYTWPDIILEQHFLTLLVKDKYSFKYIIENYFFDPNTNQKALDLGYTHLGMYKNQYYNWVMDKIKEINSKYYKKILKLCTTIKIQEQN